MNKLLSILFISLAFMQSVFAQSTALKPYQKGDWKTFTKPYAGQPVVIHFWGVTCSPCAKEMPLWGKFLSQNKNAKIIFIQVDDVSSESASKMLTAANVNPIGNYTLASPFDDALRYEIDPKWRGETPMTLLVNKNGKVIRKTGSMDFEKLKQWYTIGT
ncbi:TlpA disulfide reductase family protein [Polynucleobacter sp. MG-6-Vaara-E2]|uniref:TlpA family protein disulfide reductase n=1 Tax=Polynucleobacter sp. MG-6-Vaara-E2 TaxID=2576932 RepID=UPI001BFEB79C|nr:TlpA disulfide reductase family protein [Polynucleobacter sp. MG-6-Vaara-E2]QWD95878.1 TlpA family protein disulfide reductase [Polynucleobacter sp. MG-6-Vaara-E2]